MSRFFRIVLSFFTKKRVKLLGKVGLIFSDRDGKRYFLNTELVAVQEFDLIILDESPLLVEDGVKLPLAKELSREILNKITSELYRIGLRYKFLKDDI